jgi:hypothetical protein
VETINNQQGEAVQTFRVHDAVDDLLDDLVVRAKSTLEDLDAQMERLQATRHHIEAMVAAVRGTPQATINGPKPAPAPKLAVVQADTVTCPHCDVTSTPHGLKVHIARKHRRPTFDAQAARDAAATAI